MTTQESRSGLEIGDSSVTSDRDRAKGEFSRAATPYFRVRHRIRTAFSEHPAIYLPFARRKYRLPSPEVIGPETELVIDGYTRSACTFAVYALQLAQERPVRLAHHLHAPAQLIAAAKAGVPAIVVIRDPKGAVLSQVVREPRVDMRDAITAYTRFYSVLMPYRAAFTVGEFETVTTDFGSVIRRLNARFGTSFNEFVPTDSNVKACFDLVRRRPTLSPELLGFESGLVSIEELQPALEAMPAQEGVKADTWVPSAERDREKEAFETAWMTPALAKARARANAVYQEFLAEPHPGTRRPSIRANSRAKRVP
ncbi:MAG TPA: hypothetical protein VNN79_24200 [Actinomycetota bacterium]|nr:hypothetical protein [Actinomycetota bacterium]